MTVKALIFDFGGVLVRTEDRSGRQKWENRLDMPVGELSHLVFGSETALQASLGKAPESVIWENLGRKLNLAEDQLNELRRDFWSGDRIDLDLVDFIQSLRPRLKTAILSNAWSNARELFTQTYHLDKVFDLIVISAEEGIVKPDPQIYQRIVDRLEIAPSEAVFIDDFPENIEGARRTGMQAILFKSFPQIKHEIASLF